MKFIKEKLINSIETPVNYLSYTSPVKKSNFINPYSSNKKEHLILNIVQNLGICSDVCHVSTVMSSCGLCSCWQKCYQPYWNWPTQLYSNNKTYLVLTTTKKQLCLFPTSNEQLTLLIKIATSLNTHNIHFMNNYFK